MQINGASANNTAKKAALMMRKSVRHAQNPRDVDRSTVMKQWKDSRLS
jgi:hypothetical protein